ncbi:MAG: hypothetical protein IPK83_08235 [Planctomycetes bacterium]|nr:hypothetical protein [Planctomycetota bacterium]
MTRNFIAVAEDLSYCSWYSRRLAELLGWTLERSQRWFLRWYDGPEYVIGFNEVTITLGGVLNGVLVRMTGREYDDEFKTRLGQVEYIIFSNRTSCHDPLPFRVDAVIENEGLIAAQALVRNLCEAELGKPGLSRFAARAFLELDNPARGDMWRWPTRWI